MNQSYYETERLHLRPFQETDAESLYEMECIPEVHQYLGKLPLTHPSQAVDVIKHIQAQYEKNGIGRWIVLDKATNEFLGWCGLKIETIVRPEFNYFDLGYRFHPKAWGKGIATESATFWKDYAFKNLKISELNAATHAENIGSMNVLKKLGFVETESFYFENEECRYFSLIG